MSKIGIKPVTISPAVVVEIIDKSIKIKGKEGEIILDIPRNLIAEKNKDTLLLKRKNDDKKTKSLHGLYRSLIANAVLGVEKPWQKKLEVVGTGFNVKLQGEDIALKLGFSHPVVFKKQRGVKYSVEGNNKIIISGADKQFVGQVASQIKKIKKPDAYKGKGIRNEGEKLKLKPGKKVKTTTGAA